MQTLALLQQYLGARAVYQRLLKAEWEGIPEDGFTFQEPLQRFEPDNQLFIESVLFMELLPDCVRFCITERDMSPEIQASYGAQTDIIFHLTIPFNGPNFEWDNVTHKIDDLHLALESLVGIAP